MEKRRSVRSLIDELGSRNITVQLSAMLFNRIFKSRTVPASVVAALINVSPNMISKFNQRGIIDRESDGNYNVIKALNQYVEHVRSGVKKKVEKAERKVIRIGYYITRQNRLKLKPWK